MLFFFVGEIVALVLKHPKSTRENVISYRELLYTCKEIISDFVFFGCLIVMRLLLKMIMDWFEFKVGDI